MRLRDVPTPTIHQTSAGTTRDRSPGHRSPAERWRLPWSDQRPEFVPARARIARGRERDRAGSSSPWCADSRAQMARNTTSGPDLSESRVWRARGPRYFEARTSGAVEIGRASRVTASSRPMSERHFISVVDRVPSACTNQSTPTSLRSTRTIGLHGKFAGHASLSGLGLVAPLRVRTRVPSGNNRVWPSGIAGLTIGML